MTPRALKTTGSAKGVAGLTTVLLPGDMREFDVLVDTIAEKPHFSRPIAIERRPPYVQDAGDVVGTCAAINHLFRLPNLRWRECLRTTDVFAAALRGPHPGDRAFAQHVALELRDGAENGLQDFGYFAHPLEKFRASSPPEALEPAAGDARVVDGVLGVAMAELIVD